MKTLVIHPKDSSTDFLRDIYEHTDWTIIDKEIPASPSGSGYQGA